VPSTKPYAIRDEIFVEQWLPPGHENSFGGVYDTSPAPRQRLCLIAFPTYLKAEIGIISKHEIEIAMHCASGLIRFGFPLQAPKGNCFENWSCPSLSSHASECDASYCTLQDTYRILQLNVAPLVLKELLYTRRLHDGRITELTSTSTPAPPNFGLVLRARTPCDNHSVI